MAWVNAEITAEIPIGTLNDTSKYGISAPGPNGGGIPNWINWAQSIKLVEWNNIVVSEGDHYIIGNSQYGLNVNRSGNYWNVIVRYNSQTIATATGSFSTYKTEVHDICFCVGLDSENQKGSLYFADRYKMTTGTIQTYGNTVNTSQFMNNANMYSWITGLAPVLYTWQSVPSISGKNGILQSLSTLVNINDGNPVSGASASAVNIIPASVVSGMIQTGASDVIVSFEIPQLTSGTYDSIKLVGKRGEIPKDKTDGESITTLTDTDISKTITGLAQNVKYWFVIFTEDSKGSTSESEPYDFIIGDNPLPYVRQGYKTDNSPELYWATYRDILIDSPSVVGKDEWKAYIAVIHRQTITLPSGWTLLDKQVNKSGWQYVSIYSKVVTQSETVRVSQTSENALAVMSFYTDKDNTIVYEDDYYGDTSNPMKWVIPPSTEPRIFVFSLGYTVEVYGTNSVVYSPSLNGWQTPAIYSTTNNYRAMMFYMTGEETSDTTVTYNGFAATGQWAEDKLNSSQICSYKVIYQKEQ